MDGASEKIMRLLNEEDFREGLNLLSTGVSIQNPIVGEAVNNIWGR